MCLFPAPRSTLPLTVSQRFTLLVHSHLLPTGISQPVQQRAQLFTSLPQISAWDSSAWFLATILLPHIILYLASSRYVSCASLIITEPSSEQRSTWDMWRVNGRTFLFFFFFYIKWGGSLLRVDGYIGQRKRQIDQHSVQWTWIMKRNEKARNRDNIIINQQPSIQ